MNCKKICIGIIALTFLQSCIVGKVKEFTPEDLKWFKSYHKTDTVLFQSDAGEFDTIIFHKTDTTKFSVRDVEQGFYDRMTLSVAYEFTKGSYHQFGTMSGGTKKYDQDIFRISNSSLSDFTDSEIIFIGIIFSGSELNNIKQLDNKTYFFDRNKATYPEINVEKGINNFTFDTEKGITKYTDNRNVNWTRT